MQSEGRLTPKPCDECGSDPVFHALTRWSIVLENAFVVIASPGAWAAKIVPNLSDRILDAVLPTVIETMKALRLGHETFKIDDKDFKYVTHVLWDEAEDRSIKMVQFRPFGLAKHLFTAQFDGEKIVFDRIPIGNGMSRGVSWIDDKDKLKKQLLKQNLPVAKGDAIRTEYQAIQLFKSLRKPVIVKPHQGSATRHTTLHVTDTEELIRAFRVAKLISPYVMIEEELTGAVYRPTVVNGKLVATIERHQPHVIGDGINTIEMLIALINTHPKRKGPIFSQIKISESLMKELARQHMSLESIPALGVRVQLNQKINWSVGGHTRDVTDIVHPDNVKLFEEIARLVKAPIVGIDFVCADITKSWKEQAMCGVLETNSMPFFDTHHYPYEGKPRDVAGAIWDMVFPKSKP